MRKKSFYWIVGLAAGVLGVGIYFLLHPLATPIVSNVLSFEACVAAGYPVMETYPRQCKTPDGRTYTEDIVIAPTYSNASADNIKVETPYPGAVTGKAFGIRGEARGTWYFEASFPIFLIGKDGKVLATAVAQAQGDWMTTEFVPFQADMTVPESYIGPATLILKKDNPSGIPAKDASVSFPITVEY